MNKQPSHISIRGGHLIDPANGIDADMDIHIQDGRVVAVGCPPPGFQVELTIMAHGLVVCPGFIDLAVRLREPGQEHKSTIASETTAAAAAGITTMCCMPDTQPVIDTPAVVELIRSRSELSGKARVLSIGAITQGLKGEHLTEMAALQKAGCVAVSNINLPLKSTLVERHALEYASTFDLVCIMQPTDHALQDHGCVHEGYMSARLGLPGIPETAETVALARDLLLAEQAHAKVHFHALSSASGVALFGRHRYLNTCLSADVAMHNLHLTEEQVGSFDSNCHVIPPLRSKIDCEMLRRAVADGRIAAICSDHQPHDPDAKTNPFPATAPGISGLDTLLPLALRLVDENVMSLAAVVKRLTWGPASCLDLHVGGIPLGRLNVGSIADICIFDPNPQWSINKSAFFSRGHNTPFHGWNVRGQVVYTILEGKIVFQLLRPV